MTVTPVVLVDSQYAPNAQTTLYTVPGSTTVIVDKFTATNVTGSAATLTVNLVPSGSSAGSGNVIISALSIAANTCVDLSALQNQILATGALISVIAGTASAIVVRASGRTAA